MPNLGKTVVRRVEAEVRSWCGLDGMRFKGDGELTRNEATADGNRELLIALDGHAACKSTREVAEDLCGAESVAAQWSPDGVLRSRVRRLLRRAGAHAKRE